MNQSEASDRKNPRWWDHQRQPLRALRKSVVAMVESVIRPAAGMTIVDLGCGDRPYEDLFTDRGATYVGCDIGPGEHVEITPGARVPLDDNSADAVVSFQVLEHVGDLDWYLGEAHRVLKPTGVMLLSTHGNWLYHPHPTDFRRWTREGLIRELELRSFDVFETDALMGPLAWTTQFRLLGIRHALLSVPVAGPLLLRPIATFMNLRMVIEDAVTPKHIREQNASVYVTLSRKKSDRG
jgi:SAM-dependent methyltransferase